MPKFAVNWYRVDFHVMDPMAPPIEGARLERHAYGMPPFEVRDIWVLEVDRLETLLESVAGDAVSVELSRSIYWSGDDLTAPGNRLFGIAVIDNADRPIDPRDVPIRISGEAR